MNNTKLFLATAVFGLAVLSASSAYASEKEAAYLGSPEEASYLEQLHRIRDQKALNEEVAKERSLAEVNCVGKNALEILASASEKLKMAQAIDFLSHPQSLVLQTFGLESKARVTNADYGYTRLMRRYFEVEKRECFVDGMKVAAGLDEIRDRELFARANSERESRGVFAGNADKSTHPANEEAAGRAASVSLVEAK